MRVAALATGIGFIALAAVAAGFGVVMLLYLEHALQNRVAPGSPATRELVDTAIREGAVQRVRPKAVAVAVAVILAGLLPIVFGGGTEARAPARTLPAARRRDR